MSCLFRLVLWLSLMVSVIVAGLFSGNRGDWLATHDAGTASGASPPHIRSIPSVENLQRLADLVSLRVQVSDILTVDQPGWLHGYRGVWIIKGDAQWVTDLTRAHLHLMEQSSGRPQVRIELPNPAVAAARLDHAQTRTFDLRSKGWLPLFSVPESAREEALHRAQQIVEQTANQETYRNQAKQQTETVLKSFYAAAGFPVEVVWHEAAWNKSNAGTVSTDNEMTHD